MNRMHANPTGLHPDDGATANAAGLSYAQIMRDPQLMERLIRDAKRARSEAIARMFVVVFNALWVGARRIARAGWTSVSGAARHVRVALTKANPPARHC